MNLVGAVRYCTDTHRQSEKVYKGGCVLVHGLGGGGKGASAPVLLSKQLVKMVGRGCSVAN
jgi:hypothetical protein